MMRDAEKSDSNKTEESRLRVSASPLSKTLAIGLDFENQAIADGFRFVAGVDEVGRGCLAGTVVAAACILDPDKPLPEFLNDSKKISAKRREAIAEELKENALCFAVGEVSADEIDRINILEATKKAMRLAIENLQPQADFLLIDALHLKEVSTPQKSIIKGDSISASIAAASILAKTYRDAQMRALDEVYPGYGFAKHAGYGTKAHFEALRKYGACAIHRKSFRGVL